ncbi:hypothetical protein V5799_019150 [Amblyomma americanum]|uniref:Secreted protein n=1 Tax=Amblyomma americanum TaxID=6943 RepID=A0AAQ4EXM4_AMBAM
MVTKALLYTFLDAAGAVAWSSLAPEVRHLSGSYSDSADDALSTFGGGTGCLLRPSAPPLLLRGSQVMTPPTGQLYNLKGASITRL